jgi:hypothetical protein
MDINRMLSDLRTEHDRITQAIAALEALDGTPAAKQEIPIGGTGFEFGANKPGGRHISAAGRARIAAAARKRWAERRKQVVSGKQPSPAKEIVPARHIGAATRKSELAKKRWAARKKGKTA